jgi:tripartite-type tricarboxylate transporter receptor subunit TctC
MHPRAVAVNMMLHAWRLGGWILICLALAASGVARAQADYPVRPVRLIVASPAGGGTDTSMRIVAPRLGEILGQQIVIDNRGGAAGNIGAEAVARAAPDGYTIGSLIASHTSNPYLMARVPYDLERDFAPVSLVVAVPNVLISHPSLPARNVKELIALARARPGELQYASAGLGSVPHLMMALFVGMARVKMVHVPYKGAGPALIDVVAGHVPLFAGNILNALPHVKAGRVRAYGVTSAKRSRAAPDIPAIGESLPGYEAVQWFGVVAPAATPREILARLHKAVVQAVQDPAVRDRFVGGGGDPTPSATPEAFRAFYLAEGRKWGKIIRDAGIRPE